MSYVCKTKVVQSLTACCRFSRVAKVSPSSPRILQIEKWPGRIFCPTVDQYQVVPADRFLLKDLCVLRIEPCGQLFIASLAGKVGWSLALFGLVLRVGAVIDQQLGEISAIGRRR
jgi:hypothetical protein